MGKLLTGFWNEQDGAVTMDWVVLTAFIVGLGIAVIAVIGAGALDSSTGLGNKVGARTIKTTF